jgi:hypothetical protein
MQRQPEEAEVVDNGHDLSEAEAEDAAPAAGADPESVDAKAEEATESKQKKIKKRKLPAALAKKKKQQQPRDTRSAATKGVWVSEPQKNKSATTTTTKRHRASPETLTTDQVLHKALSDGTIQDMFLRSGIATKTTSAADKTRRIFLSVTKTLLEATLAHTASRRCRTATLEDVRHGHKSQVGRALYTHTPTCKADYVNRRPEREKTLRLRRKHARALKQTLAKPLEAAAANEKN